ncbi:MAG: hypothetical protein JW857_01445, partial [Bacteroidales bacterium]|nr:hypothetical protein [Bacteroidales bacterium]
LVNEPITFTTFKGTSAQYDLTFVGVIAPIPTFAEVFHWIKTDIVTGVPVYYNTLTPGTPVAAGYIFAAAAPASTDLTGKEFSITGAGLDPTNDMAYFTSHIRGSDFGGEVFAVSYTDGATPALGAEFSIFDQSADYNDLTMDLVDDNLWVAGDNNARGAIARYASLTGLNAMAADLQQGLDDYTTPMIDFPMPIMGPSGNSVTIFGDELWFVSGGTSSAAAQGGLFLYDKTTPGAVPIASKFEYDAKHFDMGEFENTSPGEYNGAFLWGNGSYGDNEANLRVFNTSTAAPPFGYSFVDYTVDADVTLYGKNAIDVDGIVSGAQFVYCAMGADGIIKVATQPSAAPVYAAGDVVDRYKLSDAAPLDGTGLANGLVVYEDLVYVAYGASGLVVFDKNDLAAGPVSQFNMDLVVVPSVPDAYQGSCNYVAIDENVGESHAILWVGFGTGGMAMFTIEK